MLNTAEAVTVFGVSLATIQQWFQQGSIHGCTTPEGNLLVCTQSIRRML
ncbi:MAG: hypothetical protein WA634_04470 [Silvibacterium sp.]